MQLHTVVGSPNGRKVEAVINHLGLKVELVFHDFFSGELQAPAYRAINSNGMVPTLVDGDLVLWESNAIMQYLADTAGADGLLPREPRRRADVVRWLCWELAHYNKALGILAFEAIAKPMFGLGTTNAALIETAKGELARFAAVLEAHMQGRRHVSGQALTLADFALMSLEPFMPAVPFNWAPFPAIRAYAERMRAEPAWAATAPRDPSAIGRLPAAA